MGELLPLAATTTTTPNPARLHVCTPQLAAHPPNYRILRVPALEQLHRPAERVVNIRGRNNQQRTGQLVACGLKEKSRPRRETKTKALRNAIGMDAGVQEAARGPNDSPTAGRCGKKNGMERYGMLSAVKGGASHTGGCCPSTRLPEPPASSIVNKPEIRAHAFAALPTARCTRSLESCKTHLDVSTAGRSLLRLAGHHVRAGVDNVLRSRAVTLPRRFRLLRAVVLLLVRGSCLCIFVIIIRAGKAAPATVELASGHELRADTRAQLRRPSYSG